MSFFSSHFSASISQPKMRQEGFHLPSPTPSNGNPPSPSANGFDMFLPHHTSHTPHSTHTSSGANGAGNNNTHNNNSSNGNSNGNSHFPNLTLPDAFSRSGGAMDFGDELASLMANSPATSNERSTHSPTHGSAFDSHTHANGHGGHGGGGANGDAYRPPHNIFDISAPSTHYSHNTHTTTGAGGGGHAFSLPHTTHRPDLGISSQPSSLSSSHHAFDHHHHHNTTHHQGLGRDGFTGHFNSTIPPLSTHHDPVPPTPTHTSSYGPYSANGTRESPSPPLSSSTTTTTTTTNTNATTRTNASHNTTRSPSRSRSRAPATVGTTGPTRTTKTASKRRDSLSLASHVNHAHYLATPPGPASALVSPTSAGPGSLGSPASAGPNGSMGGARPQAIVIPSHSHSHHAHAHGHHLNGHGHRGPGSPMTLGATSPLNANGGGGASGWFLPTPGSAPGVGGGLGGGEFSLPTPDSVHGHGAFGQFGTSVGSMGISPKETSLGGKGESPPTDPASKQAAIVSEKRRRRRESHNAVERRRRDNINEKISELATLIPEVMLDPSGGSASGTVNPGEDVFTGLAGEGSPASASKKDSPSAAQTAAQAASAAAAAQAAADEEAKEGGPVKANKGMILRKSVEYIRYLQQLVNAQAARNRDLEAQLVRAGVSTTGGSGGSPAGVTSSPSSNGNGNGMGGGVNGKGDEGDVLNLHSFGPEDGESPGSAGEYLGMNLGMGGMSMGGVGFGGLEPMAESHEMEMDEDYGHHHHHPGHSQPHPGHYHPQQHHQQQQHHAHHQQHGLNGHANANGMNGLGRMRPQRDGSGDLESVGEKEETSPSAGSEEDGIIGALNGGGEKGMDMEEVVEERGRRGRDGRLGSGVGVGKGVKEESLLMDV